MFLIIFVMLRNNCQRCQLGVIRPTECTRTTCVGIFSLDDKHVKMKCTKRVHVCVGGCCETLLRVEEGWTHGREGKKEATTRQSERERGVKTNNTSLCSKQTNID